MLSFEQLINDITKTKQAPKEYLLNFFTKDNFKKYEIINNPDKDQKKAIKLMFESKKELLDRVNASLKYDPFCLEAFFVYFVLSEDIYVNYRFEAFYNEMNEFGDLDDHQKYNYLRIMQFYVEFLIDIHNFTRAIKVQKMLIRLRNSQNISDLHRLSYLYYEIEDSDEFYRLYASDEFDEYMYLLLIVTLLKNDESLKAKEVLLEMFEKIEYSTYLDHLWDLNLDDPVQKKFYSTVESNYSLINCIPDFFSWVNMIKENNK